MLEDQNGIPKDELTIDQSDKVRWIDISTMLADPITKNMKSDKLESSLADNILDLQATVAS